MIAHTGRDSMPTEEPKPDREPPTVEPELTTSMLPDPAYWQSLGQFVERFALAEVGLFAYLAACATVPNRTARALLAGLHADQFIEAIRKVWQIRPPDDDIKRTVDDALVQLKHISA